MLPAIAKRFSNYRRYKGIPSSAGIVLPPCNQSPLSPLGVALLRNTAALVFQWTDGNRGACTTINFTLRDFSLVANILLTSLLLHHGH